MKAGEAIAEILKREGVEVIFGYPVNHILEYAARAGIRPIIVRQERIGLHMADALSRLTSGRKLGVFAMQHGPGAENAFGGIAQAYGEAVPILVLPQGYPRRIAFVQPNFNSSVVIVRSSGQNVAVNGHLSHAGQPLKKYATGRVRHLSRSVCSCTAVSIMESGAGSVAVSARPILP